MTLKRTPLKSRQWTHHLQETSLPALWWASLEGKPTVETKRKVKIRALVTSCFPVTLTVVTHSYTRSKKQICKTSNVVRCNYVEFQICWRVNCCRAPTPFPQFPNKVHPARFHRRLSSQTTPMARETDHDWGWLIEPIEMVISGPWDGLSLG